ncbi:hypothetical protein GCM10007880_62060 [Mesorhizobium amorphae]|nr:hypothetical protein GCM10007880_62060 [Mesorhizobium amorphae]
MKCIPLGYRMRIASSAARKALVVYRPEIDRLHAVALEIADELLEIGRRINVDRGKRGYLSRSKTTHGVGEVFEERIGCRIVMGALTLMGISIAVERRADESIGLLKEAPLPIAQPLEICTDHKLAARKPLPGE